MRNATLATIMVLTLAAAEIRAADKKPPADVGPGRIAWFDITTTNLTQSREFYGKLFDWQFNPVKGTDQAAEIVAGGAAIGTIRVADGKISPFNGVVYVQVPDLPASCKKVSELGKLSCPDFPSTSLTAPAPSPSSSIRPATRSVSTRGPRCLPRRTPGHVSIRPAPIGQDDGGLDLSLRMNGIESTSRATRSDTRARSP